MNKPNANVKIETTTEKSFSVSLSMGDIIKAIQEYVDFEIPDDANITTFISNWMAGETVDLTDLEEVLVFWKEITRDNYEEDDER